VTKNFKWKKYQNSRLSLLPDEKIVGLTYAKIWRDYDFMSNVWMKSTFENMLCHHPSTFRDFFKSHAFSQGLENRTHMCI
jgi:hypothetical protein